MTNPLWVIKTRMMTQGQGTAYYYHNTWHAFQSIIRTEGWRGLYKGLVPSIIGISHVAVQFPLYERLKRIRFLDDMFDKSGQAFGRRGLTTTTATSGSHQPDGPGVPTLLVASTLSKLVASSATYPHEVIRTRLQNEATPPVKYKTLLGTLRTMVREEGWRSLYRGMGTNLIRTVPASAVTLLSYETLMTVMEKL